jgi:gliding motility-associated-like protein
MFTDQFHAWHLTSDGISEAVISHIGTVHGFYNNALDWSPGAQGQMQFNSQGTKLAVAISNVEPGILEMFDFNNTTGIVSNMCQMLIDNDTTFGKRIYGIEFSPDGNKLYAAVTGSIIPKRLYQFNLSAGDCNSIKASRQTIFQSNTTAILRGMQLAPNGKIYMVCNSYYNLGCINFPDQIGLSAGFDSIAVPLSNFNSYTLPSFVAGYKYHNQLACTEYVPIESPDTSTQELKIPNIFSPNGDGINDTFIIENLPAGAAVQIYNRWGALVAEWNKPDAAWDGRTKGGSPVSAGVYYYIVTLPYAERMKGFVEVIR